MNKKGMEMTGVGALLLLAIAVIVAMSLIPQIAGNIAATTKTNSIVNQSFTFPNSSATTKYITLNGQAASSVTVWNTSGALTIPSSNFTVTNYIVAADGTLATRLTAVDPTYAGYTVKVSYTSEPYGYDTNAGGRSVTDLILILTALAVAVVAVTYVIKNDIFDFG